MKQQGQPKVRKYFARKDITGTRLILIGAPDKLAALRGPRSHPEALPPGEVRIVEQRVLGPCDKR